MLLSGTLEVGQECPASVPIRPNNVVTAPGMSAKRNSLQPAYAE